MKLYQLPPEFEALEALAEDGELTPESLEQLEALQLALEQKLSNCCQMLRHLETRADAFTAEAKRLNHHAQVASANAQRLKEYMASVLDRLKIERIEAGLFKLRMQLNPPSVRLTIDPAFLPHSMKRVTVEPDKRAILDQVRAGAPVPEGVIIETTRSLRIH